MFVGTTVKINVLDNSAGFQIAYLLHLDAVPIVSGAVITQSRFARTGRVSIVNLLFFFDFFFFYYSFNNILQTESKDDNLLHINQTHSTDNVNV